MDIVAWQGWCRKNEVECLAMQLPGRGMRSKEPFLASPQEAAQQLLPVVADRLADAPYVVCLAPTMPHPTLLLFTCPFIAPHELQTTPCDSCTA